MDDRITHGIAQLCLTKISTKSIMNIDNCAMYNHLRGMKLKGVMISKIIRALYGNILILESKMNIGFQLIIEYM